MVLKNDGQPPEKPWATVTKMMGNVFYFYEQRFPKPWATDGNMLPVSQQASSSFSSKESFLTNEKGKRAIGFSSPKTICYDKM